MGLNQLIKVSTRITYNASTFIDHTLTRNSEKAVKLSIIETSLSGHQLIFCTKKIKREKPSKHNYLTFWSMKKFSTEICEKALSKPTPLDYENIVV